MSRALILTGLLLLLNLKAGIGRVQLSPAETNRQTTLSYWNDNWPFQDQLAEIIKPGDDDHMTASWRLEILDSKSEYFRTAEFYYAIFTDRSANYRFDVLAGRYGHEFQRGVLQFKLAAGLMLRGSLGGDWIQNNYHALRGFNDVELPYLEEWRYGGLFYGRAAMDLLHLEDVSLQTYGTMALRLGAGPTSLRSGFELKHEWHNRQLPLRGQVLTRLGYAYYLRPREVIEPHFKHGRVLGVYAGLVWRDRWGLSVWLTENQYGLDDPHYGLTLSYRRHGLMLRGLQSAMFP